MVLSLRFAALLQFAVVAFSSTLPSSILTDDSNWITAVVDGVTYTNKGLVAVGQIPSNIRDNHGDTIGGWGSACVFERGTWSAGFDGTYSGVMVCHPDRGMNLNGTVDFQSRRYRFPFKLNPYFGTAPLSFADALNTFEFNLEETIYYVDKYDIPTTGLDALGVRPQEFDYPWALGSYPNLPIASPQYNRISLDVEGLFELADGTFCFSDEYGPMIYHVNQFGVITAMGLPSNASLPYIDGRLNFTSVTDPPCGRQGNTGFEGFTGSPDSSTVYGLMQAALMQDGGSSKKTSNNTRFYAWRLDTGTQPELFEEYIVQLPMTAGKTMQQSEMHYLNSQTFLVLPRDTYGWGDASDPGVTSEYKQIAIFSIKNATNILGSKFDQCEYPVAPDGVLDSSVVPAPVTPFINLLDSYQLGRLGMNNGSTGPAGIIDKFESIAIAPANTAPNDYFVLTCCDNDFQSTEGWLNGVPYNASVDIPNQCKIYLANLPGIIPGSVQEALSIPYKL